MLCCAMGVAAVATGAIGWRRFRHFFYGRLSAHSILAAAVVAMTAMTGAALAMEHFSQHAAHASGDATASLANPGALPLRRDSAPSARIDDLASIKE